MNVFYIFMVAFCISFALTPINIYISKKYGKNLKTEEEFLKDLPVIPLLQENTSLLLHSDIQGLSVAPSGDIYLKYIVII